MSFGICNAPAKFEHLTEFALLNLTNERCLVQQENMMVVGRMFEEQLNNLQKVF
jgi:hypothetical protein